MNHLSESEFVDLVDGRLPQPRVAHVRRCDGCRGRADALRYSLAQALVDGGDEPSPLFWDHFSARISESIRREPAVVGPVSWRSWVRHPASLWAVAASVAMLLLVAAAWRATLQAPAPSQPVGTAASVATPTVPLVQPSANVVADDADADESWAVVRTAAEGLGWDDAQAAGISARPGSAERIALELNADERRELARLLENELKRSGA